MASSEGRPRITQLCLNLLAEGEGCLSVSLVALRYEVGGRQRAETEVLERYRGPQQREDFSADAYRLLEVALERVLRATESAPSPGPDERAADAAEGCH